MKCFILLKLYQDKRYIGYKIQGLSIDKIKGEGSGGGGGGGCVINSMYRIRHLLYVPSSNACE